MTPEEHLSQIQNTLDYVATLQRSHDEQIGKLTDDMSILRDSVQAMGGHMTVLTERTIQAMDAINRLANIAANHEDRIDALEDPDSGN